MENNTEVSRVVVFVAKNISEVTHSEWEQWKILNSSQSCYNSPLLEPEFANLVAAHSDHVKVIFGLVGEKIISVFCGSSRVAGMVRPLGAPFDDYSGPLIAKGYTISMNDMLRAGGWHSYRSDGCAATEGMFSDVDFESRDHSFVAQIDEDGSASEYLAERWKDNSKRMKNFRRLSRKLDKDFDSVELRYGVNDPTDIKQLFEWKSTQFRKSGLVDVIEAEKSSKVLQAVSALKYNKDNEFGGYLIELRVNGALVAGHFGVRSGENFHPWISAYDPEQSEMGPGIILLYRAIEAMDEMGLKSYDLSGGHDHYKKYFAKPAREVGKLVYFRPTMLGTIQAIGFKSWNLLGTKNENSIASRMRRRFDHLAICETRILPRFKGFLEAFLKRHNTQSG